MDSVRANLQKQQPMLFLKMFKKLLKKKINVIGIFFDLSKVYDVLDHKILPFKLDAYGIRGIMNQWFKLYLCNWKQYVEINYMENTIRILEKFTSTLKETKGGVSQGSILGPVLFLLNVNDLPIDIQGGRTTLFADDDANIQIEATNANILNEKIKGVIEQLSNWFHLNKLIINSDKTITISFHSWQNKNILKPKIVFQDMDIKYKNDKKFLGYILLKM